MGAMQNNPKNVKDKSRKRGSVNNERRLDALLGDKRSSSADWGACGPETLQAVVVAITELGGAVTFGLSRDQGGHMLTLMLDGERETLWFNGSADLEAEMITVREKLKGMN